MPDYLPVGMTEAGEAPPILEDWADARYLQAGTAVEISDETIAAAIADPASDTRAELDAVYVAYAAQPSGGDDLAALQAIHDAMPATGGLIHLAAGDYEIASGTLAITKPVKLVGVGASSPFVAGGTRILTSRTTGDVISVAAHGCTFEDFAVVNTTGSTPTTGAGIHFTAGNGANLHRVTVYGFYDGVRFDQGYYYAISKCHIQDNVRYSLNLANAAVGEGDHGDQVIEGNVLGGLALSRIPTAAIHWASGGGLRIVGNKINGSIDPAGDHSSIVTGIHLEVADGVSTSVVVISGNSIEAWNSGGIVIAQQSGGSGTGSIAKIVIDGNEIAGNNGTAIAVNPAVATTFRELVIDGNSIGNCSGGIYVVNVEVVNIGTNTFRNVVSGITKGAGVTNFRMLQPVIRSTSDAAIAVYEDTDPNVIVARTAQAEWTFDSSVPDVTSDATYTTLWKIKLPEYSGAILRVAIAGNLNGIGAYLYDAQVTLTRATGAVTATVSGTPITAGGAIMVTYDTASESSAVWIGVKRSPGVGTKIQGQVAISVKGKITKATRV